MAVARLATVERLSAVLGVTAVRRGHDPDCRYARVAEHLCVDSRGEPVREGGECFVHTHLRAIEEGRVIHAAERELVV